MPFESPQFNHQKELLTEINSTLKKIQSSVDSLNQNINKLETIQNDSNSNIITDLHSQISNVINKLEQTNGKSNNNSSFGGFILIILIVTSIVFGFHFWDVPAQTNAINQRNISLIKFFLYFILFNGTIFLQAFASKKTLLRLPDVQSKSCECTKFTEVRIVGSLQLFKS